MSKTRQRIHIRAAIISATALGLLAAVPENVTTHETARSIIADGGSEHGLPETAQ